MIKRIKLSDRILIAAVVTLFGAATIALVWLRFNWESIVNLIQIVQ